MHGIAKVVALNLNRIADVEFYLILEARRWNMRHRTIGVGVDDPTDALMALRGVPAEQADRSGNFAGEGFGLAVGYYALVCHSLRRIPAVITSGPAHKHTLLQLEERHQHRHVLPPHAACSTGYSIHLGL